MNAFKLEPLVSQAARACMIFRDTDAKAQMEASKSGLILYSGESAGPFLGRGASYGRTSYVRSIATNQTSSVDAQTDRMFDWFPANHIELRAHAWDNSVSASTANGERVGLYGLIDLLLTRRLEIDYLVCKDTSRLLRNDDDQEMLEFMMKEFGITIVGVGGDAPISTRGPGSPDLGERITWKVLCEVYKYKKQENQENQRLYTEERVRASRPMTSGLPPFGHRFAGHRITRTGTDGYDRQVSVPDEKRELNRVVEIIYRGGALNSILTAWNDRDGDRFMPAPRSVERLDKLIDLDDQDWSRERLERMRANSAAKGTSSEWSMTALKHALCAARQIGATEEPAYDPGSPSEATTFYWNDDALIEANYELGERDLRPEELATLVGLTEKARERAVAGLLDNLTFAERRVRLEAKLRTVRSLVRARSDVSSRPLGPNGRSECSRLLVCDSCQATMTASTCKKNDTYRCGSCSRSVRKDMVHELVAGATLDWLRSGALFARLESAKRELGIDDLIRKIKDDEALLEMLTRDASRNATAYRATQGPRAEVEQRIEQNQTLLQGRLRALTPANEELPPDIASRADWYWENGVPNAAGELPSASELVAFRNALNRRAWKRVLVKPAVKRGRGAGKPDAFAARFTFDPRD